MSDDGTVVDQQGDFKQMDTGNTVESVKGSYSYTDDEGQTFSVTYTADENGYRPVCQMNDFLDCYFVCVCE